MSNLGSVLHQTHLVYKQNKMQHKQCNGDKCPLWEQAKEVALPLGSLSNTIHRSLKM